MKKLIAMFSLVVVAVALLSVSASWAQLNPPNEVGVTMGHVHLNVRDIEAAKKFYVEFGGTPAKLGAMDVIKFPGILFILRKADPTGDMEGSTVNHIGFLVKDGTALFAKMQAQGVKVASNGLDAQGKIYGGYVYSPDGVKIEIIQRTTLTVPLQFDQVHFFVADPGPNGGAGWSELQKWYATTFGVKIQRDQLTGPAPGNLASAPMAQSILSAVNFRYSKQDTKAASTKGRAMDHIGFEIKNLEAFCKQLEAKGVKFDRPYTKIPDTGIGLAFITDPLGTYIELNEGLDRI